MFAFLDATIFTTKLEVTYLVLAFVGLLIVTVCIGAYVFGYGVNIRDRVQEISAFGAQLKISVITFLILVGVLLIVPLVWNQFNDLVKSFDAVEKERKDFKDKFENLMKNQTKDQVLLLDLDGLDEKVDFKKEDFSVVYFRVGAPEPQDMDFQIVPGRPNRLRVTFQLVNDNTTFPSLEVNHPSDLKKWKIEGLTPTIPIITLKKAEDE